eukprot:scaffold11680_cov142-Cylindrotheca_fusiformis.AAC.19
MYEWLQATVGPEDCRITVIEKDYDATSGCRASRPFSDLRTSYDFSEAELGAEWFLIGGKGSVARVALSQEVKGGATSLPKIFMGGSCTHGCSELSEVAKSGELEAALANVPKERRS